MISLARESTAYRSRLLAFDQKGLYHVCNVGFGYWLKKKWIYRRLKKCLRDFKTRDHLCLFPDLLSFGFVFFSKMICPAPQCRVWAFLFVFFVFVSLRTIISVVFMRSSNLLTKRSIYLHCFIWMIMKDDILHDQFQHPSSLLCLDGKNTNSLILPPSVGCDPSQGYFQKASLGSKWDCNRYFLAL